MSLMPLVKQLTIRTKDLELVPIRPNWAQTEFLHTHDEQVRQGKPVRIVVLKARQLGLSTITNALLFARSFVYEQSHSLVIAHENDASEYLFGMTHLFWETFPYHDLYTPKYISRRELSWKETGSSIRIATARNVKAGRGRTVHALHASEVAFWEHPEETMLGMRQTIPNRPGSMIVLESTANGVGNWFYDVWNAAVSNDVDYVPLFFPWWKHYEYTGSASGLNAPLGALNSDEKLLTKLGVSEDHLVWRRWAIRNLADNNEDTFRQEYPATPEEAFIASGTNVFPIHKLKEVYEPQRGQRGFLFRGDGGQVEFKPDISGPLTIFRLPSSDRDWGKYFVGGDPTHTTFGDNAVAQVINRRTYEQVAIWQGKIDPMSFGEELAKLGTFYNNATISTEIEGPGYATVGRLVEMNYPQLWQARWADKSPGKIADTYGWSTTFKRKEWAVGHLLKLVVDRDITIHHDNTMNEMRNYVTLPQGGYGNAGGRDKHDDCVMALAIACICASTDGPQMAYVGQEMNPNMERIPQWADWDEE